MHIPDDIIDKIAAAREVYVVFKFDFQYELTNAAVLGVFTTKTNAKTTIIKDIIKKYLKYDYILNPGKRFSLENRRRWYNEASENDKQIVDTWRGSYMAEYSIETWHQDYPNSKKETEYCNIETWVKRYLSEDMSKTEERCGELARLGKSGDYPVEWYDMFGTTIEKYNVPCKEEMIKEWINRFGQYDIS